MCIVTLFQMWPLVALIASAAQSTFSTSKSLGRRLSRRPRIAEGNAGDGSAATITDGVPLRNITPSRDQPKAADSRTESMMRALATESDYQPDPSTLHHNPSTSGPDLPKLGYAVDHLESTLSTSSCDPSLCDLEEFAPFQTETALNGQEVSDRPCSAMKDKLSNNDLNEPIQFDATEYERSSRVGRLVRSFTSQSSSKSASAYSRVEDSDEIDPTERKKQTTSRLRTAGTLIRSLTSQSSYSQLSAVEDQQVVTFWQERVRGVCARARVCVGGIGAPSVATMICFEHSFKNLMLQFAMSQISPGLP